MRRLGTALFCCLASAQTTSLKMPAWLTPHPGAAEQRSTASTSLADTTYKVPGQPEAVVKYFEGKLEQNGLPFTPNFDGIGNTLRAQAKECDLLIQVREQDGGSAVRIACTAPVKQPANAANPPTQAQPVPSPAAMPPLVHSSVPRRPEPKRERSEAERKMLDEAEKRHQQGIDDMKKYDEPYYGNRKKKE